jgi:hypothetical protein
VRWITTGIGLIWLGAWPLLRLAGAGDLLGQVFEVLFNR